MTHQTRHVGLPLTERHVVLAAPNDEVVVTFALALGSQGDVRTTTLKAFTKEVFAEIVKKLP